MTRSKVEFATLARAGLVLALAAAGGVVAANFGIALVVYISYATVGAILIIKRSGNGIGLLLTAVGWEFALAYLPLQATVEGLQTLTAPPIVLAVAWLTSAWGLALVFTLLAGLAIVFPTGRLPVGRWRRPAMLLLLVMGGITLSAAIWPVLEVQPAGLDHQIRMPNPLRLLPAGPLDGGPGAPAGAFLLMFALLIASIVSMLVRYVRSTGVERLQLRWLVTGLASVAAAVPVGFILFALFGPAIEGWAWLPAMIAFTLPPIAIGIAVLRYRLYEIDRLISRTIGWALVTAVLVAVFAGTVVGLQAILSRITQGETLAVAASTLVAFALFQPVRRQVQKAVDRRFDRARYDGDRTTAAFTERLREQVDLAGLEADITGTVASALRPRSFGVWIRRSGQETTI
jgi:hypothetical protein